MSIKEPLTPDLIPSQSGGPLPFVADKYLQHVEDCEMTEPQKAEFLRTLWDIMATFVRLGFGVENVLPSLFREASGNDSNGLEESIPTHEFNVAAQQEEEEP